MKKNALSVGKRLQVSLLLPLAILGLGCNKANAEDIYAPVPTLTKLHDAGETIPDTNPPVVYPESAYTITVNDNSYNINIKEQGSGNTSIYYKWANDGNGNRILTISTPSNYDFVTKYENTNLQSRITNGDGQDITGNFYTLNSTESGGAIYLSTPNHSLGDIVGDFTNNFVHAIATGSYYIEGNAYGGAISNNNGTIKNITGDFINNYVLSSANSLNSGLTDVTGNAHGGAIYNLSKGTITSITGDFINNYASGYHYAHGGAICNHGGKIENIQSNFIGNNVLATKPGSSSEVGNANGGAIYNDASGIITSITGDFINNYALAYGDWYFASGGAIYNSHGTIPLITGDFINNFASATNSGANGGAISNSGTISNIKGNFIGNYVSGLGSNANGGAVYNAGSSAQITNFTGDFVNNYAANGGAIYNSQGTLDIIMSNFIGNYASSNGGAIYNNQGTINSVTGNFINNNASANSYVYGGAIYNAGKINSIVGDFMNNFAAGNSYVARGGAIYNAGKINSIVGDFMNNYVTSNGNVIYGGAISNENGSIGSITGNFISNYLYSSTDSYGGAIFNCFSINSISGDFVGNYNKTTSLSSKAYGGAIFNGRVTKSLDNYTPYYDASSKITISNSTFTDNFVDNNGVITPNSIYNAGVINIVDGTTVTINDGYDGLSEAKLNVGMDSIFNLSIDNDFIQTDNLGIVTNNGTINLNLDIDLSGTGSADTIKANNSQENISNIILNDINIVNGDSATQDNYKIQILNTQEDKLQLKLGENISDSDEEIVIQTVDSQDVTNDISGNASWNETFGTYTENTNVMGKVSLETTNTTNDSIGLNITGTKTEKIDVVEYGDTLALVNQLETTEDRSFSFDTANDKYNASSDLGTTTAGKLSINGEVLRSAQNDVIARSEINLNGHKGFELDNETTLNVNDTRLTGNDTLITANNQNAIVNLQNADLNGSIAAENSYSLNITGDTSDRTIINGGVGKANATHSGGELGFNTDTFKDAEFSTTSGTVDLVTGQVENYDIGKLTSDESANWIFEVDSSGSGADTLTVGTGSSGTVNVSEINFINGDSPSDEFTVQVLNAQDDNIQLAVDSSIAGENHKLGTVTRTSEDTVTPTAKWNQTFNKYTQNGANYGNIDVATTNTTNDSLQLKVTSTEWDEKAVSGSMGDTLALVNQLETEENRNFNFDTANDVYEVKSDLGTTSAGVMNVNGILRSAQNDGSGQAERSTINGNNYNMFVLSNPTTLNLNNVKIQGANSVVSGTNKNAVINMNNTELKNNASGITTASSVNISGKSVFDNNGNGIEVTDENSIITLNGLDGEGYDVTFKDKLKGVSGAKLNLKAGQVEFHKSVTDLDINMEGTTANLASDNVFNGQNLTVASASNVSMINNSVGTMQLNSLTLNDNMNLGVDVDLANKSMDRISANTYNLGEHKVNVNKMNLLSDAKEVRTDIEFADEGLRNTVTTSVSEVAYSPIYKYGVKYDQNNGEFQFTRSNSGGGGGNTPGGGGSGGNSGGGYRPTYNDLNPAIMASPVAAQMGGYAGMLDNYGNALNHMDMFMLKPHHMRKAELNANKYAIADSSSGTYISNETNTNGIWIRPYTSYDSVGLKHGPKVHNLSYGSFIGGDFGMHDFGNDLYGEFSPYISYQGAHQHYSGNSVYQNGGSLGFTGTLYKGNFFTGLTAGVGANVTEASTMYGNEDFPMLTTGVASKTGYNIEFKDGKFIIQPSLLVSYTFVNTFDYKNGAGVRIDTAPLHAVQISPNIRFSFNTKNHWQPYAFVGMNWNIMDSGHFKAADTTLPELSMKPYVQYGLGIQKLFSDNFTAFAQVAIRNGGRNGVGGTLGLKWILGGQPQKQEEQKPKNVL